MLEARKSMVTSASKATGYVWSSLPLQANGGLSTLWLVPSDADGLSVPAPNPSWGNMIYSQLSALDEAPTVWMVPSALIFLSVLSFNYLGDVVRARFDVRESVL